MTNKFVYAIDINLIDVSDKHFIYLFYKNHRLIYIIKISLIEQNNFILYHAIPFPIKQGEKDIYVHIYLYS